MLFVSEENAALKLNLMKIKTMVLLQHHRSPNLIEYVFPETFASICSSVCLVSFPFTFSLKCMRVLGCPLIRNHGTQSKVSRPLCDWREVYSLPALVRLLGSPQWIFRFFLLSWSNSPNTVLITFGDT